MYQTIVIDIKGHDNQVIYQTQGKQVGKHLCVHKCKRTDNFQISHISEGLGVGPTTHLEETSLRRAEYIDQYGNWDTFAKDDPIQQQMLKEVVLQSVKEFNEDPPDFDIDLDSSPYFCNVGLKDTFDSIGESIYWTMVEKIGLSKAKEFIPFVVENLHDTINESISDANGAVDSSMSEMYSSECVQEMAGEEGYEKFNEAKDECKDEVEDLEGELLKLLTDEMIFENEPLKEFLTEKIEELCEGCKGNIDDRQAY